jgi:dTDP-4-dehydrorhamnose 3,5-epimerase
MIFKSTALQGVHIVSPERLVDERGFFARTFCEQEFREQNLDPRVAQCSLSFNPTAGTLRGLHYQRAPFAESRLVRCTMGAIYDVVVDLRLDSPSYCRWVAVDLSATNREMIYIPEGCAHGFLTLVDNTEVLYQMSQAYAPSASTGVRWNDLAFGITWPLAPRVISRRDATYRDYPVVSSAPASSGTTRGRRSDSSGSAPSPG